MQNLFLFLGFIIPFLAGAVVGVLLTLDRLNRKYKQAIREYRYGQATFKAKESEGVYLR